MPSLKINNFNTYVGGSCEQPNTRRASLHSLRKTMRVFCNSGYKMVFIRNRSNLITQLHAFVINFSPSLNPLNYIYIHT